MSTDRKHPFLLTASLAGAAALIVVLFVLVQPHNPSMAKGLLAGGLVAVVGAAIAIWRASRGQATTAERSFTQLGDERDDRLAEKSLAVGGWAAFLWMAGAGVAIAMDVRPEIPLTLMIVGQMVTVAAAYSWYSRRL